MNKYTVIFAIAFGICFGVIMQVVISTIVLLPFRGRSQKHDEVEK